MASSKAIEGAIRHAAQETQQLALIFSGSNPHLLKIIFEDERRPLYKLCRKLVLDRIHEQHYIEHLNKASKALWNKVLNEDVLTKILYHSECHPYYVNYLCDAIWSEYETMPSVQQVDQTWLEVVEEERSDLLKDFFSLPENQRKVMIYIANHGGTNLHANEALKTMDIIASSMNRALTTLIEKDHVEKTKDGIA